MLRAAQAEASPPRCALKDVATENDFEKRLLAEVIPAEEVGVGFDDIGALESTKQTLREVRERGSKHAGPRIQPSGGGAAG